MTNWTVHCSSFNRTSLELKLVINRMTQLYQPPFNRTSLELKLAITPPSMLK